MERTVHLLELHKTADGPGDAQMWKWRKAPRTCPRCTYLLAKHFILGKSSYFFNIYQFCPNTKFPFSFQFEPFCCWSHWSSKVRQVQDEIPKQTFASQSAVEDRFKTRYLNGLLWANLPLKTSSRQDLQGRILRNYSKSTCTYENKLEHIVSRTTNSVWK